MKAILSFVAACLFSVVANANPDSLQGKDVLYAYVKAMHQDCTNGATYHFSEVMEIPKSYSIFDEDVCVESYIHSLKEKYPNQVFQVSDQCFFVYESKEAAEQARQSDARK